MNEIGQIDESELGDLFVLSLKDQVGLDFISSWIKYRRSFESVVVGRVDGLLAGCVAFGHTKRGYLNVEYLLVDKRHRRKGLASGLLDYCLRLRPSYCQRLRVGTTAGSDGDFFWRGYCNLKPIGSKFIKSRNVRQLYFDLSLDGVLGLDDLVKNSEALCKSHPSDKFYLSLYSRIGVERD